MGLALLPGTGLARAPETPLEMCVSQAAEGARNGGAVPGEATTVFMLTGDSRVFSQRWQGRECVGFLAAGSRHVQSVELVLQAEDGRLLARSARPSTLAYAQHCGTPGETVLATVRVLDGQGEVVFEPLRNAGPRPAALQSLESCAALGTPRPAPLDVGPELPGPSIEAQLDAARDELAGLGYRSGRLLAYGAVRAGQHAANGLVLTKDKCFALVAVGSQDIVDLDLRVFGPKLPLTAAGSDLTRSRAAHVKLCAEAPARYVLDVAAFQGEGAYAVAALELNEPAPVPGIAGSARIAYAELVARMHARGLNGRVVTTGIVEPDEQLAVPIGSSAPGCFAVGALDASERNAGALQLGLKADDGELVAYDAPSGEAPLLFHCSEGAESLQAVVRPSSGRRETRFVLVVGRDAEETTP